MLKTVSLVLVSLLFVACNKEGTAMDVRNSLPPTVKDSPEMSACLQARTQVQNVLHGVEDINVTTIRPPAGCMVSLQVTTPEQGLTILKKIKAVYGSLGYIHTRGGRNVGLWITTAPAPLTHDKTGRPIIVPAPTNAQCNSASSKASQLNPNATVTVKSTGGRAFPYPCYLDLAFHDDVSFESFFNSTNPYSVTGDIFRIDVGNGTTVLMHPYRALK